jgi:hypothetical protein
MQSAWPHIEKFVPLPVCFGTILFALAMFVAVLVVIATGRRRDREEEAKQ